MRSRPTAGERFYRDDATRWVLVGFGLVQATVTMLMAFDVIDGATLAQAVTAVALVAYVAVNELLVKPRRSPPQSRGEDPAIHGGQREQEHPSHPK